MIAGVCGGLGDYFGVDPVIVRLIFVLLTLTTYGAGLVIYAVLWAVMPKSASVPPAPGSQPDQVAQLSQGTAQDMYVRQAAGAREAMPVSRVASPPPFSGQIPPAQYNFDPLTGEPINREGAATGQTVQLDYDPMQHPPTVVGGPPPAPQAAARGRRWRWLGFTLLAIGALALADAMGINSDIVFATLMIAVGLLLLRRK